MNWRDKETAKSSKTKNLANNMDFTVYDTSDLALQSGEMLEIIKMRKNQYKSMIQDE